MDRGRKRLLTDLEWRIEPGQHWVILGPNGCGKTTLLKALTGYLTASAGRISLLGHDYGTTDWRELKLQIGMVSSAFHASIPPAEPAWETVVSGKYAQLDLWKRTTKADRSAALKLLRTLDAAELAEREWIFLSQGERQRVLIARALMARPRLLILDEPCAGLDPVAREHFLDSIEALAHRRSGPALVLVTHHVEEITPGFTHALLLRRGRIVAAGPREKIMTAPLLRTAFDARVRLVRRNERYALTVLGPTARNNAR